MQFFHKISFIIFLTISIYAADKTSVLIIHSYSQEYPWTKNQHSSLVKTLKESGNSFDFHTEHLDTKHLKLTPEYQQEFLNYLKFKYKETNLHLIYITDDNALTFMLKHKKELFKNKKEIPIFFSGINNLDIDKILDKDSFAGIYEVKDVKPNIELIKQFSPQTRDIWFIGDNSNTYHSIKKELKSQQKEFSNMNFHYLSDEYASKIKEQLPDDKRSFVILTTIGNLKDDNNHTLKLKESISIFRENKNIIILSMEDAYMTKGVVGGYVSSAKKQGSEAAKLILNYQINKSMEGISSLVKDQNIYIFNSKELTKSRIILSQYIARKATIIGKDLNFIEKNESILLNTLFIFLFILALGFIVLYAIQRKKYKRELTRLKGLQNLDNKFHMQEQLIDNIFELDDICYWKIDTENNKVFISNELINILGPDVDLYKDDQYFLQYFLNSNDKSILSDNISYVKSSKKSIKFNHKIITSNKSVFNAKHIIFAQNNENLTIVGILKIEK